MLFGPKAHDASKAALAQRMHASGESADTHLEAAGDGHAAFAWHMRAATWATNRDLTAARASWQRAQTIADALPTDDTSRAAMRICCASLSMTMMTSSELTTIA